jgi:DNA-binding XRE family transcriptional regulator
MATIHDDLDAAAAEWTLEDPDYPLLVKAFQANQALLDALAERRSELGASQRAVAKRMGTSQPAIDKLEAGEVDPRLSTIQRLAVALGATIRWEIEPAALDTKVHGADRRRLESLLAGSKSSNGDGVRLAKR